MSNEPIPPPAPLPPYAPVAAQRPRSSHLLLKVIGAIVAIFILHSLFSSKSTTAGTPTGVAADGVSSGDNPLIGSWTLNSGSDSSCADKVQFTSSKYFSTLQGVKSGGPTVFSIRGANVTVQTNNVYGFDQFTVNASNSITKQFCSSMSCTSCPYTKD